MKRIRDAITYSKMTTKIAIAMLAIPVATTLILFLFLYNYMKDFYEEKVEIFQTTNLDTIESNLKNLLRQVNNVSDQVLTIAVMSDVFEDYDRNNAYEKLLLNREITSQLTNIYISNNVLDAIYLLDFQENGYSSNIDWDKAAFVEQLEKKVEYDQSGESVILPPHRAEYKYLGSDNSPYVMSFLTYLNRFSENGAIGLIQLDVAYRQIQEAVEVMKMTESDFSFVVDQSGNLIYAPAEADIGKRVDTVSYGAVPFAELLADLQNGAAPPGIKCRTVKGTDWTIIQVNSDFMLLEELGKMRATWLVFFLGCLAASVMLALGIYSAITRPIRNLISTMDQVGQGIFNITVDLPKSRDLALLVNSFNAMVTEVDRLMEENIQKEREKTRTQMLALNTRINSHFLYNTLNTIKWQAVEQDQMEIANTIVALCNILAYGFKSNGEFVTIGEEKKFIEDYVFIQNIRYDSNIRVVYEIDESLERIIILKMLLQPVIENAMIHAFDENSKQSRILFSVRMEEKELEIKIKDNGKGFVYEGFDTLTGIGLTNIRERLLLYYGEAACLRINSVIGEGTEVEIRIPVVE